VAFYESIKKRLKEFDRMMKESETIEERIEVIKNMRSYLSDLVSVEGDPVLMSYSGIFALEEVIMRWMGKMEREVGLEIGNLRREIDDLRRELEELKKLVKEKL